VGLALDMVHQALHKMGGKVLAITNNAFQIAVSGKEQELIKLRQSDQLIDQEHAEILLFLQKLQQLELSKTEANTMHSQIEAANILESIADLMTTDLVEAADHRIETGFAVSMETETILTAIYNKSLDYFERALTEFSAREEMQQLIDEKTAFKEDLTNARNYLVSRLSYDNEQRIEIFRFESEVLEVTRRLHSLSRRLMRKDI
jgi:phosphate:Na+ symporter